MIKTQTSYFREIHPEPLDLKAIFSRFKVSPFDETLFQDPDFKLIISTAARAMLPQMLKSSTDLTSAQRARLVSYISAGSDEAAALQMEKTREIVRERLPDYLQLMEAGEQTYLLSDAIQDEILASKAPVTDDPSPSAAHQIIFTSPAICKMFVKLRESVNGKQDISRISLSGANVCVSVAKILKEDGKISRFFMFAIYLPKGGSIRSRNMTFNLLEDQIREIGISKAMSLQLAEHTTTEDPTSGDRLREFVGLYLEACRRIEAHECRIQDPLNPRAILSARAENPSLPQKQRNKARQMLPYAPAARLTPVTLKDEPEIKLSDLIHEPGKTTPARSDAWKAEVAYEEKIEFSDLPAEGNPHKRLFPQRVSEIYTGIGEVGPFLSWHAMKAREFIEENTTEGEIAGRGSEGIRKDQVAIDIPPRFYDDINDLVTIYQAAVQSVAIEDRPESMESLRAMLDTHDFMFDYKLAGSQCFILNGDLSDMMVKTDIADIDMAEIKLPYDALYLGFEKPVSMKMEGETVIFEGAFIKGSRSAISILMNFAPVEKSGAAFCDLRNPLKITLPRLEGASLEHAILTAIYEGGYDLETSAPMPISEADEALGDIFGSEVFAAETTSQTKLAERNERLMGEMIEAVTITANSIMAMSAGPDEISVREVWTGISDEARYKLQSPTAKGREAGRRMVGQSALPVRVITLSDEARDIYKSSSERSRKSPEEAYWRRGHWRQQAYGKGRALRRWVWIAPQLCNAEAGVTRAGSVYVKDL